jgi:glycerol-3-phosphate acyltransferase PlsX
MSEGTAEAIITMLKQALSSTLPAKVGAVLSRQAYEEFRRRVDYSEYGGAPLLGVRGVSVICHGRSNANAIKNAIRVAAGFADREINQEIEKELQLVAAR